jgi:hypothetical protein
MYQNVMAEVWYGFWVETTQFGGQTVVMGIYLAKKDLSFI